MCPHRHSPVFIVIRSPPQAQLPACSRTCLRGSCLPSVLQRLCVRRSGQDAQLIVELWYDLAVNASSGEPHASQPSPLLFLSRGISPQVRLYPPARFTRTWRPPHARDARAGSLDHPPSHMPGYIRSAVHCGASTACRGDLGTWHCSSEAGRRLCTTLRTATAVVSP